MTTFGERLKHLRAAAGLSQPQLAERSGVPVGTIRDYEQERRQPLLESATKLARALGVDCTAFQVEDKPAEPAPAKKKRKGEK